MTRRPFVIGLDIIAAGLAVLSATIAGIGGFFVNSMANRDYTLTVGLVTLYAVLLVVLNLAVDLAYTLLDPRVRYE